MGRRVPISRPRNTDGTRGDRGVRRAVPRRFRRLGRQLRARHVPRVRRSGLIDRIAADMSAGSVEMGVGSMRYALNREPAILEALPHIHAPKVAINPDIAPTDVGSLRDYCFEAIVLDNVGHFLMLEDPARFNPVLVKALRSFDR